MLSILSNKISQLISSSNPHYSIGVGDPTPSAHRHDLSKIISTFDAMALIIFICQIFSIEGNLWVFLEISILRTWTGGLIYLYNFAWEETNPFVYVKLQLILNKHLEHFEDYLFSCFMCHNISPENLIWIMLNRVLN